MKPTRVLSWKSFVSKIHPPLPMSPQESQRLLALLNTSFKQQLDRHYPPALEDHTRLHLSSILTNPLFDARPRDSGVKYPVCWGMNGKSLGLIQDLVKRPMDIFKEQMAAGTTTIQSATLCLQAEYRNCLASSATNLRDAMRSSKTGSVILEWLWSSGIESTGTFLGQTDFMRHLVAFLIAERQISRIWSWLQQLRSDCYSATSSTLRIHVEKQYRCLLLELLKSEISLGEGVDAAVALFIQAVNDSHQERERCSAIHNPAAWYLTNALNRIPKTTHLHDVTIWAFMDAAGTLHKPRTLMSACHWVQLVETPDPAVALGYFQSRPSYASITLARRRSYVILLGLRTAEVLLERGREVEASWVMDYLLTNFGKELGLSASSTLKGSSQKGREDAEESSLRSLDALAIE